MSATVFIRRKADGQGRTTVTAGKLLAEWDPFSIPIVTEVSGIIEFADIIEAVTMQEQLDEVTGLSRKVIMESKDQRPPAHRHQG